MFHSARQQLLHDFVPLAQCGTNFAHHFAHHIVAQGLIYRYGGGAEPDLWLNVREHFIMTTKGQFDIPEPMRELAERNVDQARSAYDQVSQMAQKAQDMASSSSDAMAGTTREIQAKALDYARENMESGFSLAADLAKARDLKEYFEIQTGFAQKQMQTYTQQAQELGRLIGQAAQNAKPK